MSGLKVLVLLGQLKHSRIDNGQATLFAEKLAKGGTLYTKNVYFNMFIKLPSFLLSIIPIWLMIKHIDDFKDISECDAIVVSGKKMIRYAKHLRKHAFPGTTIVQIGNPYCVIRKTDIVLRQSTSTFTLPYKKTIKYVGLLCKKVDKSIRQSECEKFKKIKNALNGELIGVFIGGNHLLYKITAESAKEFATTINRISYNTKMPLLIATETGVPSRIVNIIEKNLDCSYYFYNKAIDPEESPKVAFMEWSSYYILYGNSINDHSEYMSQEKPVYVYLSNNTIRYKRFLIEAIKRGCAKIINSKTESLKEYKQNSLNDIDHIAEEVKKML